MTASTSEILARAPHVLLDFDGPVCSIFGGVTDRVVAGRLAQLIRLSADQLGDSRDPFDVLRAAAALSPEAARLANIELTRLEVAATTTATPTAGAAEALMHLNQLGHTVTIVSNNSQAAVLAYLDQHDLSRYVARVSGRTDADPTLLKPNPHLLTRATQQLSAAPDMCVMVGDSASDIEAARAAGTAVIAYANQLDKRMQFPALRPDAIIFHMAELLGTRNGASGTSPVVPDPESR